KSRWEDAAEIEEARRRLDTALPRHKDVLIEAESLSCPRHRGRQSQRRRAVRITRDREAGEGGGPHGGSLRALLRGLCLQRLGETNRPTVDFVAFGVELPLQAVARTTSRAAIAAPCACLRPNTSRA